MRFWVNGSSSDISGTGTFALSIDTGNFVTAVGSFRAPIFYDSDNTNYYVDPVSTSNISALTVARINNLHPSTDVWHESSEGKPRFYFAPNSTTYYRTGAYFVFRNNADTGIMTVQDSGYLKVNTGGDSYASYPLHVVGTGYATGDFRAPIFYDSDNAGYYADFNNTGTSVNIAGSVNAATYNKPGLLVNASGTSSSGGAIAIQQVTSEGWTAIFADFEPNTGWGLWHDNPANTFLITAETSTNNLGSNTVPSRSSGNRTAYTKFSFAQEDGTGIAGGSWRAPIFYDSNNTNYYVDPASLSILQTGVFAGTLSVGPGSYRSTLKSGALELGDTGQNYLYTGGWTGSMGGGILANCLDQWEIVIHDSAHRLVSPFAYYGGPSNNFIIMGRDIGWGTTFIEASSSFRAPVFYDSNDTAYYVNPNSNSAILDLYIDRKLKQSGYTGTRFFSFNVGNECNTKAKLHFSGWFWGNIEISATSSYNYANRAGIVKRLYSFGGSPTGDQYVNESRIVESMGQTPGGITFGNIFWDSAVSKWAIIVASRDCSSNGYQLEVKCFCPDSTSRDAIIDSMTLSATYTSDSTAYPYPDPYYSGRLGIAGSAIPAGYQFYVASGPSYFQNYTYCENQIYGTLLYDSNNTGYYCDPTNESKLGRLTLTLANSIRSNGYNQYENLHWGLGVADGYVGLHIHLLGSGGYSPIDCTNSGNGILFRANEYGTATCVSLVQTSDGRYKDVINEFDRGLDAILGLRPVRFHWNEKSTLRRDVAYTGFIAQEVEPFIPEAVHYDQRDDRYSLEERPIIAALVNAVKELNAMNQNLLERIKTLESKS
jgi:hypothetical protein